MICCMSAVGFMAVMPVVTWIVLFLIGYLMAVMIVFEVVMGVLGVLFGKLGDWFWEEGGEALGWEADQ